MDRIWLIIIFAFGMHFVHAQDYYSVFRAEFSTERFNEFSPVMYKNGLVYCSDKDNRILINYKNTTNDNLLDMYFVNYKGNEKWGFSKKFPSELLTNYNEGPACFSPDGLTIYYTRSNDSEKKFNNLRGDTTYGIYTAEYIRGTWQKVKAFKYNRNGVNTGFPALSHGGDTLVFCSTMPGGKGGLDLWMVTKKGRDWGKAENLEKLNTPNNEVTPFLHASGRLYFASSGFHDREDTDILFSDFVNGEWTDPVPLKEPFNSEADDFGFILSQYWDTGYYSSNRASTDDIYQFISQYPTFKPSECVEQQENNYCYHFEEAGLFSVDTTSLRYEWDMGDGNKIKGIAVDHCYDGPGQYLVQLNVVDTLTGDVYFSVATYDFLLEDIEQPFIQVSDTVIFGQETTLDAGETFLKNYDIDNYYWDLNYGAFKSGQKINYNFPYPGTYNLRLGVTQKDDETEELSDKKCVTRKVVVIDRQKQ